MLSQLLLFLILISGGIFSAVVFRKRFEIGLPYSFFGIVLILFVFGLLNQLLFGIYTILLLVICMYAYAVYVFMKAQDKKELGKSILTPSLLIFCILFLLISLCNHGRMPNTWDEFSHWADVVKSMLMLDDLGTNENADLMFAAYPPGMALFQYFVIKLHQICYQTAYISEWRMYFAYQLFTYALFFPFLEKLCFSKPKEILLGTAVTMCVPGFFLNSIFSSVYIDTFLAVQLGIGIALVFFQNTQERHTKLYLLCITVMLVLTKQIGILFAVILMLFLLLKNISSGYKYRKKEVLFLLSLALAAVSVYVVWKLHVELSNCYQVFSNEISIADYLDAIFSQDNSTPSLTWDAFISSLGQNLIHIKNFGIQISPISVFLVLAGAFVVVYQIYNEAHSNEETACCISCKTGLLCYGILFVVYVLGLSIVYIFKNAGRRSGNSGF